MNNEYNYIHKVSTLFVFIYIVLYSSASQIFVPRIFAPLWEFLIPKFAAVIGYKTPVELIAGGSGDTTFDYFQLFLFLTISVLLSISLSLLKVDDTVFNRLKKWAIILVRYYLAIKMINYGMQKLFYLQFSYPNAMLLDQELGDFSPMGLLWNFMGYSKPYTMFTGALELIGGLLLLNRRTITLGALMTFGVMLNVMVLNFCYDVPVKLLSTHMVLMALYLISSDYKRLFKFFVKNEIAGPVQHSEVVPARFISAKYIIKWIGIIAYLAYITYQSYQFTYEYGAKSAKTLLDGKYNIEVVQSNRDDLQEVNQSPSEITEWESIYQTYEGYALVKSKSNEKVYYNFETDTLNHTIKLKKVSDTVYQKLNFTELEYERFHLYGIYKNDSVKVLIRKEEFSENELSRRKFHWISEYPYNR